MVLAKQTLQHYVGVERSCFFNIEVTSEAGSSFRMFISRLLIKICSSVRSAVKQSVRVIFSGDLSTANRWDDHENIPIM